MDVGLQTAGRCDVGESTKTMLVLLLIVACCTAAVSWAHDRPDEGIRRLRLASTIVAAAALGGILFLHFRRDIAPDHLRKLSGTYFVRDGFGFAVAVTHDGDGARLATYFVNQYAKPCTARIALRPYRGPLSLHQPGEAVEFEIPCGPGAFGVATIPLASAAEVRIVPSPFEIGVSVRRPEGRGRRLRFHDGVRVRARHDFTSRLAWLMTLGELSVGGSARSRASSIAVVDLLLPQDIARIFPADAVASVTTLWSPGDPPWDATALSRRTLPADPSR